MTNDRLKILLGSLLAIAVALTRNAARLHQVQELPRGEQERARCGVRSKTRITTSAYSLPCMTFRFWSGTEISTARSWGIS